ncbi:MAG: arginine--tRNA ligase [Candidatus Woesearchaeota archaeon]|jgi:arginyl-tRNA synthetase
MDLEIIKKILKQHISEPIEISLETPDHKFGDVAFPCFALAKHRKKSPQLIAHDLAVKLNSVLPSDIEAVSAEGPYVNITFNKKNIALLVLTKIQTQKESYGSTQQKQKIMIEFSSPNTNKPLHLGHIRNNTLGDSIARIFTFLGNEVIKACLVNDRGIHICKSMLAYKKWGHNKNPDKKSDFFVGEFYVLFAKKATEHPELEQEAQEMLQLWEKGDKETIALWKKMNQWVYDGFEKTYAQLGITFHRYYYESEIYTFGKEIVLDGLKRGIFFEKEGAIVAPLEDVGLPNKVLMRSDGTTIYMTQDIYLAQKKFIDYPLQSSVYVVGSEQNLHFQQLFAILNQLGYKWANSCYHLSYGMVNLPEGRMKSREGTVVDADTIINEMTTLAKEEISKRHPELSSIELQNRSRQVGLAALKFHMLRTDAAKDMVYNPKESISFEGETGPYIQYTHARICSILKKTKLPEKLDLQGLGEKENYLITLLEKFPATIEDAAKHYKPSYITRYLLDICQEFNSYYHDVNVLNAEENIKNARLYLLNCIKIVLENGLNLLGIEAPDEM